MMLPANAPDTNLADFPGTHKMYEQNVSEQIIYRRILRPLVPRRLSTQWRVFLLLLLTF